MFPSSSSVLPRPFISPCSFFLFISVFFLVLWVILVPSFLFFSSVHTPFPSLSHSVPPFPSFILLHLPQCFLSFPSSSSLLFPFLFFPFFPQDTRNCRSNHSLVGRRLHPVCCIRLVCHPLGGDSLFWVEAWLESVNCQLSFTSAFVPSPFSVPITPRSCLQLWGWRFSDLQLISIDSAIALGILGFQRHRYQGEWPTPSHPRPNLFLSFSRTMLERVTFSWVTKAKC